MTNQKVGRQSLPHPQTLYKNLKKMYRDLMKQGYKLHELDAMDIHFFFELYMEQAETKQSKQVYIDQIW
ncbi:hypothetical protein JF536_11515 [Priestia flexa]|uniref:Uncharacterized protein n=1 Tax=Priestia flexa TaxID=86664 RepID=A0A8I1MBA6_9BACI|nr:hypothetical protein [Priestia flexa]MBN8434724.1 hypothetical protein [Priestia flexa]QCS52385.1 hypothetical protein FED53_06970 [Priestia flexa]